jgi:hypothetical protein
VAKSTKHKDAVKSFDEFRAPWETADGTEAEIDKPKLKRYIYGLVTDKAQAQDARDDALADLATAEQERDAAKEDAEKASPDEANKKIAKLEKKVADLTAERDKLVTDKEQADLRAEVLEGLDSKYAKYVTGETREELEKSLEQVKADFGLAEEGGEENEEDEPEVRTKPRAKLRNITDPDPNKGAEEIDFDKVADEYLGGSVFR